MRIRQLFCIVCASCASMPAMAQSINYSSADVPAGASVQLGYYGAAGEACSSEPPPIVDVVSPPTHGVLSIRTGLLTTNRLPSCPGLKLSVEVVSYSAQAGYVGPDAVTFRVKSKKGVESSWRYSIDVKQPPEVQPESNRL